MTHIAIDIADEQEAVRVLSVLIREQIPHRTVEEPETNGISTTYKTPVLPKKSLTDAERAENRERIMRGSPNLDLEAMLEHLRESRQDRPMPFRDEA